MQSFNLSIIEWLEGFSLMLAEHDDISIILDKILLEARRISKADAGTIFLVEDDKLVFAYTHNDSLFPVDKSYKYAYAKSSLPISAKSIVGYCAIAKKQFCLDDVYNIPSQMLFKFNQEFDKLTSYRTVSMYCLPLIGKKSEILGVIQLINCLDENKQVVPFSKNIKEILIILAIQATNAIERSLMAKEMVKRMQLMTSLNDPTETGVHIERVGAVAAELYQVLAEKKSIDIDVRRAIKGQIRLAAMLHDLGKVGIPDGILKKPGKLTEEEFKIMQTHSALGGKLFLSSNDSIDAMAKQIATHHHQKWNGTGYTGDPDVGILKGEEIPLEARITAVADVFDALISDRCYKDAFSWDEAIKILRKDSGTHFDPEVVEVFFEIEELIKSIYECYKG